MKKITGDFDNGLGAVLIGEHSLASFLSKKSREGISGLFQQYRSKTAAPFTCQRALHAAAVPRIAAAADASVVTAESGHVRTHAPQKKDLLDHLAGGGEHRL